MAGNVVKGRFPRRRMVQVVIGNTFRYLFGGAARNWVRNAGSTGGTARMTARICSPTKRTSSRRPS